MKNSIILTAALMLCLCHVQAQPETNVSASLEDKHSQAFSTADNISWHRTDQVTFAIFRYQDQSWLAYYDNNEQLVATARKISQSGYLPMLVAQSIEEFQHKKGAMTLGPVYELLQDGSARYLVRLEGEQEGYTLAFDSMGNRTTIDKYRKIISPGARTQEALIARKARR